MKEHKNTLSKAFLKILSLFVMQKTTLSSKQIKHFPDNHMTITWHLLMHALEFRESNILNATTVCFWFVIWVNDWIIKVKWKCQQIE